MPVHGANGDGVGDARVKGSHASSGCTSSGGKHVPHSDVANEGGIDAGLLDDCAEDTGEDLLWAGVLETTLLALDDECKTHLSSTAPEAKCE